MRVPELLVLISECVMLTQHIARDATAGVYLDFFIEARDGDKRSLPDNFAGTYDVASNFRYEHDLRISAPVAVWCPNRAARGIKGGLTISSHVPAREPQRQCYCGDLSKPDLLRRGIRELIGLRGSLSHTGYKLFSQEWLQKDRRALIRRLKRQIFRMICDKNDRHVRKQVAGRLR